MLIPWHSTTAVKLQSSVKKRMPIMADYGFAEAGCLMSFGAFWPDLFRRSAIYVHKILKGAKHDDRPVEQTTKFQLIINTDTAQTLGLTLPQTLLLRADQVIQ